ncbi:MAG TPA: hypothetical protein VFG11_02340, partial [Acidobacteriota bacterium]|nr:hypothetical protein [Acidobacteriota bacterium]
KVVSDPFLVHNKIDVVRRITGGRSVLHDIEVTYAVIAPLTGVFENQTLQQTYQVIAKALSLAIRQLGVKEASTLWESREKGQSNPQCFVAVSRYEISHQSRKVIGSAQKRSRDRFLQHGSILLGFNSMLQRGCVKEPDLEIEKKIAPLNLQLNRELSFDEVAETFARAFASTFETEMSRSEMSPAELKLAGELETKYLSPDWTRNRCR